MKPLTEDQQLSPGFFLLQERTEPDEVKTIINDIVEKHCTYFRQETKDSVKLEWFKKFKK